MRQLFHYHLPLPARVYARHRVHGAWAWGRGLPRLCAPRCGQALDRQSAKLASRVFHAALLCRGLSLHAVRQVRASQSVRRLFQQTHCAGGRGESPALVSLGTRTAFNSVSELPHRSAPRGRTLVRLLVRSLSLSLALSL